MLKSERERLGFSQKELAEKAGLSLRQIQRYEQSKCIGYSQASLGNLIAILKAMSEEEPNV